MFVQKLLKKFAYLADNRLATGAIYISIVLFSGIVAFLLRFELNLNRRIFLQMLWALGIWVVLKAVAFRVLSLDRVSWGFASIPDLLSAAQGNVVAAVLAVPLIYAVAPSSFPRSVFVLDLIISSYLLSTVMLLPRILRTHRSTELAKTRKRVLIYGAGQAGAALLWEIQNARGIAYDVRGFLDDDPRKTHMRVHQVRVLGDGKRLAGLVASQGIEEILIAIPSISGHKMTQILDWSHQAGVKCKTVPGVAEVLQDQALTSQIRDVAVEDLLDRAPVRLEEIAIRGTLENNVVLITGAAGSIGSELCRQIARFRPKAIVGFDVAESPLFEIDSEMRKTYPNVPFFQAVGDIRNRERLSEVVRKYSPAVVYHAAAYKHVPMMEAHLFEAIENNVIGTLNVATVAARHHVSEFVMISSDKAVRPTSVMGATKRLAELIVKALNGDGTKFVSVRFGNVLGSNGSVIPIFKKQIAAGGPVTVTHPEMQRYFMTIPEAAQLVLQAATMGKGGEIFVLDMGMPVPIVDLARKLILLSGFRPDEDIEIVFTGIRPGEKLMEELSSYQENTCLTHHEKIKVFAGPGMDWDVLEVHLASMRQLCAARDARGLLLLMKQLLAEYNPSLDLLALVLSRPPEMAAARTPALTVRSASA